MLKKKNLSLLLTVSEILEQDIFWQIFQDLEEMKLWLLLSCNSRANLYASLFFRFFLFKSLKELLTLIRNANDRDMITTSKCFILIMETLIFCWKMALRLRSIIPFVVCFCYIISPLFWKSVNYVSFVLKSWSMVLNPALETVTSV